MKIVIENLQFPYDLGCRLLKLKNNDDCPFEELSDIWADIQPMTFKDICQLENLEQRRVAILCLGLEKLVKEVQPTLINKKTLKKQTTWVSEEGELITKKFNDTYELYKVAGKYFDEGVKDNWRKADDVYYVKCKDTSTDREYMIWVDVQSVYRNNNEDRWNFEISKVNAIQCIAWTIQTNIPKGNIEKIIRQGDCVLIKPKDMKFIGNNVNVRHLTEQEYRELLVAES